MLVCLTLHVLLKSISNYYHPIDFLRVRDANLKWEIHIIITRPKEKSLESAYKLVVSYIDYVHKLELKMGG